MKWLQRDNDDTMGRKSLCSLHGKLSKAHQIFEKD